MKVWPFLLLTLLLPLPVAAGHTWAGVDICAANKQTLPPGLSPGQLPEPRSEGARLLQSYCTQCHNLPGPDRHSAIEWRELTGQMSLRMEVSHRFGGLHGKVDVMAPEEKTVLLAYLERNAASPASVRPVSSGEPGNLWPALGLFLLLTLVGLVRWWRSSNRSCTSCAPR